MAVVDYEILTVKANECDSMERFFRDNSISFIVAENDSICTSYRLRAGMDYNDALLYNLKTYLLACVVAAKKKSFESNYQKYYEARMRRRKEQHEAARRAAEQQRVLEEQEQVGA